MVLKVAVVAGAHIVEVVAGWGWAVGNPLLDTGTPPRRACWEKAPEVLSGTGKIPVH